MLLLTPWMCYIASYVIERMLPIGCPFEGDNIVTSSGSLCNEMELYREI